MSTDADRNTARLIIAMDRTQRSLQLLEIKRKLELTNCDLLDEIDEEWISVFLFQPSEARTRLLVWLVTAFDAGFESTFQNQAAITATKVESRVQKLLFVCHIMGLCSASDLEIIKGTSSEKDQIQFWHNLLDMVLTEQLLDAKTRSKHIPSLKFARDIYKDSCHFVDTLTRQGHAPRLSEKSVSLFPPDLEKQVFADTKGKKNISIPSQKDLSAALSDLDKNLIKLRKELACLDRESVQEDLTDATVENLSRRLDIAYQVNSQQLASFCMSYEHELQPWCSNRTRPKLSGLSEMTDAVYELSLEYNKLQHNLSKVRSGHSLMTETLHQDIKRVISSSEKGLPEDKLSQLLRSVQVLQETKMRLRIT